jgi:hypothetical protein
LARRFNISVMLRIGKAKTSMKTPLVTLLRLENPKPPMARKAMVETGLGRWAPALAQWISRTAIVKWLLETLGVTMGSIPFSGEALAKLAIDPAFAKASGKYIQSRNGRLIEARSSKMSHDEQRARRLWSDSETLVCLQPQERPRSLGEYA